MFLKWRKPALPPQVVNFVSVLVLKYFAWGCSVIKWCMPVNTRAYCTCLLAALVCTAASGKIKEIIRAVSYAAECNCQLYWQPTEQVFSKYSAWWQHPTLEAELNCSPVQHITWTLPCSRRLVLVGFQECHEGWKPINRVNLPPSWYGGAQENLRIGSWLTLHLGESAQHVLWLALTVAKKWKEIRRDKRYL